MIYSKLRLCAFSALAALKKRKVKESMTYQELVKKVQTALKKADASAVTEHIAAQVNVTGEAEGAFYIEIKDGAIKAEPFDYNDRDFLLIADGADVLEFVQGKIKLEAATVDGKIAHEGDWEKALTLDSVLPVKKTAAKKTAKTKTEEPAPEAEKIEEAPAPETKKAAKKEKSKETAEVTESKKAEPTKPVKEAAAPAEKVEEQPAPAAKTEDKPAAPPKAEKSTKTTAKSAATKGKTARKNAKKK